MMAITIILGIVLMTLLSFVAVDLYFFAVTNLYRKLARNYSWHSRESWAKAVVRAAERMLVNGCVVRCCDEKRLLLWDILRRRFSQADVTNWHNAPLYIGVAERSPSIAAMVRRKRYVPNEIDDGFQFYLRWRGGLLDNSWVDIFMKSYLDIVMQNKRADGLVKYRHTAKTTFYVDLIPFMCPLLFRYAKYVGRTDLIHLAKFQVQNYYKVGILDRPRLCAHGYNMDNMETYGIYGWGRGTGWWLFGLIFSYDECMDEEFKAWLAEKIEEFADVILRFQCEDGGWCTRLAAMDRYDSSATAMFAYYLYRVNEIKSSTKYSDAIDRALDKLMNTTLPNGKIDFAEANCKGLGNYSKLYTTSPFAQGLVVMLINKLRILK